MTAWGNAPKPRNLASLEKEAEYASKQILLSFMSDPYQPAEKEYRKTRKALEILKLCACSVAILTKGGLLAMRDLDLFESWPDRRVKIGATLTFVSNEKSLARESGAALPDERFEMLKRFHENGIETWASIEPVIDPDESIAAIQKTLPFVDGYKIGKLNHKKTDTDWRAFGEHAVRIVRSAKKKLYVKDDLRAEMKTFAFRPEECNPATMFLPERKDSFCLV